MMKKFLSIGLTLLFALLLLLYPAQASAAVGDGLLLCANTVIPSLFPFFVVVSLLGQLGFANWLQRLFAPLMGPLFRMDGVCVMPLMAGLLGGYPSGAKAAAELYEQNLLSRQEAQKLLGFCNNCGPAFLLGYVGTVVLKNPSAGWQLYCIHAASALITGMLLCRLCRQRGPALLPCRLPQQTPSFSSSFTSSVTGAFSSTMQICAYVTIFRVAAALLPLPPIASGVLEMVSGVAALSPGRTGFVLAAAITSWGGLSVHFQAMSVTGKLSMKYYWTGKAVQTAVAAALAATLPPLVL